MHEPAFLTAEWRDLLMLTWSVDQRLLAPYLPRGVELDLWRGQALVSIVAFRFERVRVRGVAIPFHTAFPEVNLRFYVRRPMPDGSVRRGVVFIHEMVPRAAIAWVAHHHYGEPYVALPMREAHLPGFVGEDEQPVRTLLYEWKQEKQWERIVALAVGAPRPMRSGSLEEFVAEHYWGYTARDHRATREYEVQHDSWEMIPLGECFVEADIESLYGRRWLAPLSEAPISTFLAIGSPVTVFGGRDLEGTAKTPRR